MDTPTLARPVHVQVMQAAAREKCAATEAQEPTLLGMAMRTAIRLAVQLMLVLGVTSLAQAQGPPLIAGWAPFFEGGVGYTYTRSQIFSTGTLSMNGVLLSGTEDFTRYYGLKAEVGYSRCFNAFAGRSADLLTYMGGPVVYPIRRRKFVIYGEGLLGGARETGVNFQTDGTMIVGYVNHFSWAAGGGVQFRFSRAMSVRVGADYLRSAFFNSNVVPQSHPNLRSAVSLVYRFGQHE